MSYRYCIDGVAVAVLVAWLSVAASGQDSLRKGLVDTRPMSGPFVETDQGFMVPYEEQIPGTDITFQMVPIPAGRFLLGSPEDEPGRQDAEGPQVSVMMDPFWMGKHEVTWQEYEVYMHLIEVFKAFDRERIRVITDEHEWDVVTAPSYIYDPSISYDGGDAPLSPAVTMTQPSAKQYTKWLSLLLNDFYRLPSEAEWEYACRAGTTTAYYFGDDATRLAEHAWFVSNAGEQRHEVGQKLPNPWGLHDMHGNVAEWVLDAFTEDGYIAIGDGMVAPDDAIQWPTKIYPRVARGGSWELAAEDLRSAARLASHEDWSLDDPGLPQSPWWHTTFPSTGVGFRITRPLIVPDSNEEKDRFWGANDDGILDDIAETMESSGRGARGFVDPDLPDAIRLLEKEDR